MKRWISHQTSHSDLDLDPWILGFCRLLDDMSSSLMKHHQLPRSHPPSIRNMAKNGGRVPKNSGSVILDRETIVFPILQGGTPALDTPRSWWIAHERATRHFSWFCRGAFNLDGVFFPSISPNFLDLFRMQIGSIWIQQKPTPE